MLWHIRIDRPVFFHLEMYNEALADIKLVKNANPPDRLLPKLEQRKRDCEQCLETVKIPSKPEFKLSYEASENFPCMANVLEIKYNEEFGRHLVAKCDIQVGKVILIEDNFVTVRSEYDLSCYACHRAFGNFIACTRCPDVAFCNIDCMDRNQTHKLECGSHFARLERIVRFRIQTILTAIETFSDIPTLMEFVEETLKEDRSKLPTSMLDAKSRYHFFFKLQTSAKLPSELELYKIYHCLMCIPKVGSLFDCEEKRCFLMHLIVHHLLIRKSNSFGNVHAETLANVHSTFNHSCVPNAMNFLRSNKQISISARPLKKNEQIFISYMAFDVEERREKLKSVWGFICECEVCCPTNDDTTNRKLIASDSSYKFVLKNGNDKSELVKKKCIQFLNRYGRSQWSKEIQQILDVYRLTMESFMNLSQ